MIRGRLVQISHYSYAQRTEWVPPAVTIGFGVAGLRWMRLNGTELAIESPGFWILCAKAKIEFEFDADRDNWAILIDTRDIHIGERADEVMIRCDGRWAKVRTMTPVSSSDVATWNDEIARMAQAFHDPTPLQQLRAKTGFAGILRYIIDHQPQSPRPSPPEQLKRLLDAGQADTRTLDALSEQCGYSCDHLRVLFKREFGLGPLEYVHRLRMNRAMKLIDGGESRVKELSRRCGFVHVSHFCAIFKRMFGLTPSQAMVRSRQGR